MSKTRSYKLFFSWQSEDVKSKSVLEAALNVAVESLETKGVKLVIDYSTLGESGMPSIDQTILRKIDSCDIFLADITPVCNYKHKLGNGQEVTKEVPNPNVLVELGYAMSALGVGYVITAAHQGAWVPGNLPFDINHRSIYSFNSTNCNLTYLISEVIEYIGKNGRHRHLDKPYWIYKTRNVFERLFPKKKNNRTSDIVFEHSTVFFKRRLAGAFPGRRGLIEITKSRQIHRCLSKLLEPPLHFKKSAIGAIDPVWWFRGGSALDISSFKRLGGRRFMIGWDELKIKRIVAYIDPGRYYSNYVYVEAEGLESTGLYGKSTLEDEDGWKERWRGRIEEQYAIFRPCAFYRKIVTNQEDDDGYTKVLGRQVKMRRDRIETRCRLLRDYNYIIAAKGSAFNCDAFNRTSEDYFDGLLDGRITIQDLHEYLMRFPKPSWDF